MRYRIYDSKRVEKMGVDEGYLADVSTIPQVIGFIREWQHWEGYPIVVEVGALEVVEVLPRKPITREYKLEYKE